MGDERRYSCPHEPNVGELKDRRARDSHVIRPSSQPCPGQTAKHWTNTFEIDVSLAPTRKQLAAAHLKSRGKAVSDAPASNPY